MSQSYERDRCQHQLWIGGRRGGKATNLHGHEAVVDHDLAREEIGTNGGLVCGREALVDIYSGKHGVSGGKQGFREAK